jgi:hypothetical protein
MSLVGLTLDKTKEIQTIKTSVGYFGVILAEKELFISTEPLDSPLKAANFARKLKKEHGIKTTVKKKEGSKKDKLNTKITKVHDLYTEAEMASYTHLRFREVWVILSPAGDFVETVVSNNKVVEYCKDRNEAKLYSSYENAACDQKVLNTVLKKGHDLRRFFIEADKWNQK